MEIIQSIKQSTFIKLLFRTQQSSLSSSSNYPNISSYQPIPLLDLHFNQEEEMSSPTKEEEKFEPGLVEGGSSSIGHSLTNESTQNQNVSDKRNPFRSTFFQATILGLCSFLAPGIWGAMSSLGGGGTQSISLVNAANSSTFCLMVVTALLTPALIHLTNVRWTLAIGTLGYAPYAAGLYCYRKYGEGLSWFVVLGAALCGISAGIFWACEGAIILSYPERKKQGIYTSYWLMFRVFGQMVGGAINLGLNSKSDQAGSLSTDTFLIFIVLQCLGPAVAMLISLPHQVQRKDGTPVLLRLNPSLKLELKAMWNLLRQTKVLLLLPLIWQTTFSESVIFSINGTYFSVRSRALASFLGAILAATACYILGFLLDNHKWSLNARSKNAFIAIYTMQLAWWGWAIYTTFEYNKTKPTLDWSQQTEWGKGFALLVMLQIGFNIMYEYTYWLIGATSDQPGEVVRLAGIIRSVESAGQSVSYGINSTSWPFYAVCSLNLAFTVTGIVFAWPIVRKAGILSDGTLLYLPPIYADEEDRQEIKQKHIGDEAAIVGTAKVGQSIKKVDEIQELNL